MRIFLLSLALISAAALHAQTGSVAPSAAALDSLKKFTPDSIPLVEESVVDLRPWLPPPGEQKMNDCTAWAIAYVGKTYLEARDQGYAHATEWIIFLRGPEQTLSRVKEADYSINGNPPRTIPHRWSEQSDGFALHILQPELPHVEAALVLRDGSRLKISAAD